MGKLFKQNLLYVFIQRLVPRGKSRSASFQIHSYFRSELSNVPISLLPFLWNSCLSSVCLLNPPQRNTDSYFAMRQWRTVSCLSWQLLQHWPVFPSAEVASFIFKLVFFLVLASISLNFYSDLFSSMNYLHGRSNWHLLIGRETWLVSGTRYSSALSFEPKVETTVRAGDFKIDSGLCNCYIDAVNVVWRFLLSRAFLAEQSCSRQISFCQIPRRQC